MRPPTPVFRRLTASQLEPTLKEVLNHSQDLDDVFAALANAGRRSMAERLSRGPATVGELAEPLPLTLSAVLQHVRVLEASGLARAEKVGRVRMVRLDPQRFQLAEGWIAERRTSWEHALDRLADYLDEPPAGRR